MSLTPGTRFGPYDIVGALGAGGMGEVYRARDPKLERDVAIKVMPAAFLADADRVARFQREARTLAALNHSNIGSIYGIEEAAGVTALVLELVEGPTLADRIAEGPLPVDEAFAAARQIAEALAAAHAQGIVHRDLKPANIKVTPAGAVKVLDFGLAKAVEAAPSGGGLSMSPTITSPAATAAGVLLGTAAYMSPEQARGRPVDKRTDIWAFGCVVFEMLTARRAFAGEDISLTLAEVMKSELNVSLLPPQVPPGVRAVLKRCLQKDPAQRFHDIADVRLLMDEALATKATDTNVGAPVPRSGLIWLAGAAVLGLAIFAGMALWNGRPPEARPVLRSVFELPEGQRFTNAGRQVLAMSPDGSRMAYVANSRLYLREMSEFESKPISGSDSPGGVLNPVFAPDGSAIAYWSADDGAIKRIGIGGGAPVTICKAARPFGMTWQGDAIMFGQGASGISRVAAAGGTPEVIATVGAEEVAHGPELLPGGESLVFTVAVGTMTDRWEKARIVALRLATGERRTLIEGGSDVRYVPTGHLVYAREGALFTVPFDPRALTLTGAAVSVIQGVRRADTAEVNTGVAHLSFSSTGDLIYIPGPNSLAVGTRQLAMVDRAGNVALLKLPHGPYEAPRVSRDGKKVVYGSQVGSERALYIYDLFGAHSPRRLTFGGNNRFAVWSPDGARLAFQSDRDGAAGVFVQPTDGTRQAERLTSPRPGVVHTPESWSPDGQTLLFTQLEDSVFTLWTLSLRDRAVGRLAETKSEAYASAMFSPDGRWVLYRTRERGEAFVYLQPHPPTGAKFELAAGAGANVPVWSRDGRSVWLAAGGQAGVIELATQPVFALGTRSVVSTPGFIFSSLLGPRQFDLTPDGRLLGLIDASDVAQIHIVTNWFEELKAKTRAGS